MSIGLILLLILIVLALLGMPVGQAIGIASMFCVFYGGYPITIMTQKLVSGLDSFVLLAIPFFMLAGAIMEQGGMTKKIFSFASAVFGWIQGSLAIITCVASAVFAALTGSAIATVTGIGGIAIPAMLEDGYDRHFATAVACNAAILGPLIPPSIFLIVYGNSAGVGITALFKGAVIPGLMLAAFFAIYCFFYAKKHNLRKSVGKFKLKTALIETRRGFLALLMPVLLLGVIFGGIATPTEAAAVACVYTFIIARFAYKTITLKTALKILIDSAFATGVTMYLIGTSKISGWVLAIEKIPDAIARSISGATDSSAIVIVLMNLFLIVVGMFVEGNAAIVMLTPILVPVAVACGMSPLQFGIVLCVNLCMGLITPPVGGCLVVGNEIGKGSLEKTFVKCIPFLLVESIVLLLVNAMPALSTWLGGA
jgi:C4-dicarboxylate transporter DctM subunit